MKKNCRVLAINPGSTSTKIAVYDHTVPLFEETIRHDKNEIDQFDTILAQQSFREDWIRKTLDKNNIDIDSINVTVGRGGLIKPIASGAYQVNDAMIRDLTDPTAANHASSLGGIIARSMGDSLNIKSYIVDPVVVDERLEIAAITGLPEIRRNCIWHALNQKSVARKCAGKLHKTYEECRLVVAHMGGGISVAAHEYGQAIDLTDGLYGEGPLTPERCGALPACEVVDLCYSGKYSQKELKDLLTKKSGLTAHLGTNDMIKAEEMAHSGNVKAKLILRAMAYQVAKNIGQMAAALSFDVDGIILTGGLAYSEFFTGEIIGYVKNLAEVLIWPGEDEMEALVSGVLRVIMEEEKEKVYL